MDVSSFRGRDMVSKCLVAVLWSIYATIFGYVVSGVVLTFITALNYLISGEKVSFFHVVHFGWYGPFGFISGLFGLLFLIPVFRRRWWLRGILVGLLFSIIPFLLIVPYVVDGETSLIFGIRLCGWWLLKSILWGLAAAWLYMKLTRTLWAPASSAA